MSSLWQAYPSIDRMRALLADGSNSPDQSNSSGQMLIHRAAAENNAGAIRLIHEYGGDLNSLDGKGKSALNLCLEKKHYEATALLLELGAEPNNATVGTESTLHQAAAIEDSRFTQLLYSHGAVCRSADKLNDWPIHRATLEEYLDTVGVILHNNRDHISANGNRGLTPLHIAATSSNVELFAILTEHGADIGARDSRGRTALDIVIKNQDNPILDTYGYLLVNRVVKLSQSDNFETVFSTAESKDFLDTLTKIDNEYRRKFVATETDVEYFQNRLDEATNDMLLKYIESDERIDINEFVQIIVRAVRNGLVDEIISKGLVPKISESIFRHVLVSENESLLQELMNLGILWSKIVLHLESNIVVAYEKTLVAKQVGIRGLVWRECLKEDDEEDKVSKSDEQEQPLREPQTRVSYDKLHLLLSKVTKLWQLRHSDHMSQSSEHCDMYSPAEVMKDPLQTLALWSVLTGRFKLTPHLLRQEPYDLIPQALLVAKLLRALSILKGIEDVYRNKAINVANTCEGIAIQALRRIKEYDTSQNNILTMEYLRLPLRSYGEYDAIDLAARGESSNFVTIDVVQDALDMFWYSDFFFARNSLLKMEGTILIGFLPPLMVLLPLVMDRFRRDSPTFKNPEIVRDSKFVQVKMALDTHKDKYGHETGAQREIVTLGQSTLPQAPEVTVSASAKPYSQRILKELNAFYGIPCVKFRFHVVAHIVFVLLLSVIVMRTFDSRISFGEVICYLCLLGFLVEEVNEIIKCKRDESLASYFADGWNLIDLAAILCGILSFLLRLDDEAEGKSEEIRYWSLVLLTTTCLIYWIRLLFVSVILKSLGPKLKMMALMVKKDFLPFLYILFILMIGFGVVFQALLFPPFLHSAALTVPGSDVAPVNDTEALDVQEIAVRMFRTTFFMIVGEYGLDAKTKVCPADRSTAEPDDLKECVHKTGSLLVTNVFMVVYIIIVQILLLNVIVAMFSETIDAVNQESTAMWQFEKYDLIQEFFMRSKLPPPFNVLLEIRRLILWIIKRSGKSIMTNKQSVRSKSLRKEVEVFLYYLYYQAVSCRGQRSTFNGVVIDEEDLDEGNKIIHTEIKDIKKELKRLRKLELLVQRMSCPRQQQPGGAAKQKDNTSLAPVVSDQEL